jgi:ABC-type oligopeptide transport system substrate-binding subunit
MPGPGRRHAGSLLVLGALVGLAAGFPPAVPAQQKPVEIIETGEAATLDWQMHCDKNAHEIDRQIFDTLLQRDPKTSGSRATWRNPGACSTRRRGSSSCAGGCGSTMASRSTRPPSSSASTGC